MKYYAVSDVHGFFTPMEQALRDKGFFDDPDPHKLILCGDMLDRGKEAVKMQDFMLDLLHQDKLIFVRGNHEDLMVALIGQFDKYADDIAWGISHHIHNGTWGTAKQLSGMSSDFEIFAHISEFLHRVEQSPFYTELIPASINYFETPNYIFVHGWIPVKRAGSKHGGTPRLQYDPRWRTASGARWDEARWENGMACAELHDAVEYGKQIICGHWHCSWGHANLEKKGSEFGKTADFTPYFGKNVVAIDACTAVSKTVNCLVIED